MKIIIYEILCALEVLALGDTSVLRTMSIFFCAKSSIICALCEGVLPVDPEPETASIERQENLGSFLISFAIYSSVSA